MKRLVFIISLFFVCFSAIAQAPVNDSCKHASLITPSTTPQYDTFRIADATSDTTGCRANNDVWFKFEMPSTGGIRIRGRRVQLNGDVSFRLYEGDCDSLTGYECTGNCQFYNASSCATEILLRDSSLYGDTLYLRASKFYTFTTGDTAAVSIEHLLDSEFQPNDSCGDATLLTPSISGAMDTFSTLNAIVELSGDYCRDNEDVWFKFEVPASGGFRINQDKFKSNSDLGLRLYTGGCLSKTTYSCTGTCNYYSTGNCGTYIHVVDPSLAGDTVWMRTSPFYNFDNRDSFAIGVEEIPSSGIQSNDSCGGAFDVSNTLVSGYDSFTLRNSITELNTGYCRDDEDVWFKFEVPASGAFEIKQETYKMGGDLTFRMYEGSCASLSDYVCDSNCNYVNSSNCGGYLRVVDTSLIGDTMVLRASAFYDFSDRDSFSFRVEEIATSALIQNDICSDAFVLTPQTTFTYDTFTNLNALAETTSFCRDDEDVWFKFEVPSSGAFELDVENVTPSTDFSMQVLTGTCGSLSIYECDSNCNYLNPNNTCADNILIRDTSLAGDSVFVRVSNFYDFSTRGDFRIAIKDIPTSILPSNDDCQQAFVLPVTNGGCLVDTFNNKNTTASVLPSACNWYSGGDVWFKFEMPTSDDAFIEMSQVSSNNKDFQIAAYSGTCGSLSQIGCNNSGNYPSLSLRNLGLVGDSVFIHVFRRSTSVDGDTFGICVKDTVLPPLRTSVGQYERTTSCQTVNGSSWFDLIDSTGNLVLSVNPQGNNLGTVCFGINLEDSSSNVRTATDTLGGTAFLAPRNFYITPFWTNRSATVRLYYKERELKIWRDSLSSRGIAVGSTLEDFYTDSMRINKMDGSSLTNYLGGNPVSINPTISKLQDTIVVAEFSVTSFSNFVTGFNPGSTATPIPVEWLSFEGERNNGIVQLQWATASELNCSHFEIQQSTDGRRFHTVGIQEGNGTTNSISQYVFESSGMSSGKLYLRLKQIDFNGNYEFSKVIAIKSEARVKISPNPFGNVLHVSTGNDEIQSVELIDLFGRVIISKEVHATGIQLNLENQIDHGMYILRIITENEVIEKKVVKK